MTNRILCCTLLVLSASLSPAAAQTPKAAAPPAAPAAAAEKPLTAADLEALRVEIRSERKQLMAQTLKLTDAEATRFWPVYDQYAAERTKIKDAQYQLVAEYVNNYGKYDDKAAADFAARWTDVDARQAALRAKYIPIVSKALPGVKAATFVQIDRRTSMAVDLKIASMMPLLQYQTQARR